MKINPEQLYAGGYCTVEIAPFDIRPFSTAPPLLWTDIHTYRQTDRQTNRETELPYYIRAIATLSRIKNTYTTPIHNAYSRKNTPAERINERETVRYRHADVLNLSAISKQGLFPFDLA